MGSLYLSGVQSLQCFNNLAIIEVNFSLSEQGKLNAQSRVCSKLKLLSPQYFVP